MVLSKVHELSLISSVVSSLKCGFHKCYFDHPVFIYRTSSGTGILVVYVDDILLIESDIDGIKKAKKYLKTQFVTKDME